MLMVVVFPGTVRSQQTVEFSLVHVEVNPVHGNHALLAVVNLLQTFQLNDHRNSPWHNLTDYKQPKRRLAP